MYKLVNRGNGGCKGGKARGDPGINGKKLGPSKQKNKGPEYQNTGAQNKRRKERQGPTKGKQGEDVHRSNTGERKPLDKILKKSGGKC